MQPSVKLINLADEFYIDEGCYVIELSTVDDDPSLSIARCRVTPGKTTCWHSLDATVERYIIQSGTGLVEIDDIQQLVKPGDLVLIPADCRQRIHNSGDDDLIFLAICTPRFQPDCYRVHE
ncbi:MAG TPA: cupin domain-containing protein [Pseudomonadales bacterium]|nr:cupin domain-containing protein [Pseudomonadales bacterium]